jgi:hypothetical protein
MTGYIQIGLTSLETIPLEAGSNTSTVSPSREEKREGGCDRGYLFYQQNQKNISFNIL